MAALAGLRPSLTCARKDERGGLAAIVPTDMWAPPRHGFRRGYLSCLAAALDPAYSTRPAATLACCTGEHDASLASALPAYSRASSTLASCNDQRALAGGVTPSSQPAVSFAGDDIHRWLLDDATTTQAACCSPCPCRWPPRPRPTCSKKCARSVVSSAPTSSQRPLDPMMMCPSTFVSWCSTTLTSQGRHTTCMQAPAGASSAEQQAPCRQPGGRSALSLHACTWEGADAVCEADGARPRGEWF